jgi:hypothetical protein
LIGSAAHSSGLHLNDRLHVIKRRPKHFERIVAGLLLYNIEGSVANTLGRTLFSTRHQDIEKLSDELIPIAHVRERITVV